MEEDVNEVNVVYRCQACGKEFKQCKFEITLNPIEAESDEYYPRVCPIEMDVVAFRRISPPRNRGDVVVNEHRIYRCNTCGWEGATLMGNVCPECAGSDIR